VKDPSDRALLLEILVEMRTTRAVMQDVQTAVEAMGVEGAAGSEVAPALVSVHTIHITSKEGPKPCGNRYRLGLRS